MVRYGMIWFGMVWYGMVWYDGVGMVWYSGMVWYGMVLYVLLYTWCMLLVRRVVGAEGIHGDRRCWF